MSSYLLVTCTSLLCLGWIPVALAQLPTHDTKEPNSSAASRKSQELAIQQVAAPAGDKPSPAAPESLCFPHLASKKQHLKSAGAPCPDDSAVTGRNQSQQTNLHFPVEATHASPLQAQIPPPLEPGRIPPLPETLPTQPSPPPLTIPQPVPSPPNFLPPETRIKVMKVEVLGNTVFSQAEIDKTVMPFIGKELTFEEILDIRAAITRLYTDNGYTTSGAFLVPQDISTGVVRIQVVEGQLERVEIQGLHYLREGYVLERIGIAVGPPVNIRHLERALQLLQLDPLFSRVQADLRAGTAPGRSVLTLTLQEAPPFHGAYLVENRDSPSVGEIRHSAIFTDTDLLGFGDRFNTTLGFTEGINSYDFTYEIPVNAMNGTLNLRYNKSTQRVVEQPFSPLDLNSNAQTYSIGFRQPLVLTPTTEFAVSLSGDLRRSQTFLLGNIPFSFTQGPHNGLSKVSAIRFTQDWTERGARQVLAARSQFSFGLDAFGATVNKTGPDARFFSWLGQFQWVQAIGSDIVSVARVAAQLTNSSLLPIEQFSVGGIDTVRGYRANQEVGDNGFAGTVEVRFPVVRQPEGLGLIQLVPFFDVGKVWNNQIVAGETDINPVLYSTGVGIRWEIEPYFEARLDWGTQLNKVKSQGNSIQDSGFFFSLRLQPF